MFVNEVGMDANKEKSPYRLDVGDIVKVDFHGSRLTLCREGKIIRIPFSQGDTLVIENIINNEVYHISEPCTITKKKEIEE